MLPNPGVLHAGRFNAKATKVCTSPILAGIRSLQEADDRIILVHGQLSGPLSWLFANYDYDESFSDLLEQARQLGITAPNPLFDLSGIKVEHKLVLLARETRLAADIRGVSVSPAIPESFDGAFPLDRYGRDFLDRHFARLAQAAAAKQQVLRYIAHINSDGQSYCGLESIPRNSPAGLTRPGDRLVEVYSEVHRLEPVVLCEPWSGASGVIRSSNCSG